MLARWASLDSVGIIWISTWVQFLKRTCKQGGKEYVSKPFKSGEPSNVEKVDKFEWKIDHNTHFFVSACPNYTVEDVLPFYSPIAPMRQTYHALWLKGNS